MSMSMLPLPPKGPKAFMPPLPRPDVQQFVANATSKVKFDPGVQARSALAGGTPAPAAQQAAFQDKLKEYGNWSQGITQTVQQANMRRKGKAAAQATLKAQKSPAPNPVAATVSTVNRGGVGVPSTRGWGNYANGQIPADALTGVSFARGHRLRSDAAQALERLNAAYRQAFGSNLSITDSYRSLQGQINVARTKPNLAARPGTSVHGLGLALDLGGGIQNATSRQHRWLQENARQFGFVNPDWAKSRRRFEPWHWEFIG